jgi:hypothetical protein
MLDGREYPMDLVLLVNHHGHSTVKIFLSLSAALAFHLFGNISANLNR